MSDLPNHPGTAPPDAKYSYMLVWIKIKYFHKHEISLAHIKDYPGDPKIETNVKNAWNSHTLFATVEASEVGKYIATEHLKDDIPKWLSTLVVEYSDGVQTMFGEGQENPIIGGQILDNARLANHDETAHPVLITLIVDPPDEGLPKIQVSYVH